MADLRPTVYKFNVLILYKGLSYYILYNNLVKIIYINL